MKYHLVLFDFDGTLADSFPWFTGIVNQLADRHGFQRIEESQVEAFRGYSAAQLIQHLRIPFWKMPFIGRDLKSRMKKDSCQIGLFPGISDILEALAEEGAVLGIVSSNTRATIAGVLGPECAELFQHWECDIPTFGKPGRIKKLLKRTGIPAQRAILIGDEIRDMQAAKAAQIASGAVAWGFNNLAALQSHDPTEVFTQVEEILQRVLESPSAAFPSTQMALY